MARYSASAQPALDAIAAAVFGDVAVRDWLLKGTRHEAAFRGGRSLHDEQAQLRPGTKQPFYCNYWCGKDSACTCRVPGSTGIETDAMFLLENATRRRLAVHLEHKRPGEPLSFGQAESYPLRAACWADPARRPRRVVPHHDWLTLIVCGDAEVGSPGLAPFERQIGHDEARRVVPGYPR